MAMKDDSELEHITKETSEMGRKRKKRVEKKKQKTTEYLKTVVQLYKV